MTPVAAPERQSWWLALSGLVEGGTRADWQGAPGRLGVGGSPVLVAFDDGGGPRAAERRRHPTAPS
ncbi:hypothetical protein ACQ5JZ_06960, partial [Streptomyces sp. ZG43]